MEPLNKRDAFFSPKPLKMKTSIPSPVIIAIKNLWKIRWGYLFPLVLVIGLQIIFNVYDAIFVENQLCNMFSNRLFPIILIMLNFLGVGMGCRAITRTKEIERTILNSGK